MELALVAVVLLVAALLLFYSFATGVVPMSSSRAEIADVVALLRRADVRPGATLYELGAGWGALALALARAFPQATVVALEISPVPWAVAALRARRVPNLRVLRADFFRRDLSDADAVACYLMLRPMARLAEKLDAELAPGTPVVALAFWFRGRVPSAQEHNVAALYRWPARGEERDSASP